ncbi:MAG: FG-GAP-like repeat-containing protein, partial [Acidobacteriia bacterium]|nr:FG-GAP-like repeat-containing protein [Terriglobia bacterium]
MIIIKKAGVGANLLLSLWRWVLFVVVCCLSFISALEASAGCPTPSFAVTTLSANFGPLAVGDFNRDGKADLAGLGGGEVMILLGNGDGTFQTGASYAMQGFLGPIAVGDFNNDGKADLAIGHSMPFGVAVLLGNGDGTFQPPVDFLTDNSPHVHPIFAVQVGDFNLDGGADLAITAARGSFGGVTVLLGRGDGTFQGTASYPLGATPYALAVGDFSGDGKADLAAADFQSENVSIFLSKGNGTFQDPANYPVGSGPHSITVGDFNGDGRLDLAVVDTGSNNVSILLGNGDGTFQAPVNYPAGAGPNTVVVGDFNSDGVLDLAVTDSDSNSLSILLGHGDGSFQAAVGFPTVSAPALVLAGDFTGDGRTDLVVIGGSLRLSSLMINMCSLSCPSIILQPATLSDGMSGAAYNQSLGASGGVGTYRFALSQGFLPPGLSFSSTGTLSGTPLLGGTFSFSVTAMDIIGCTGIHDYSLRIGRSSGNSSLRLSVSGGGASFMSTIGSTGLTQAGYAELNVEAGSTPYGTAVFSLTQSGAVVSEVGVPASPPTPAARIFIDYRRGIAAKSDAIQVGTTDVNTGFAVVNLGSTTSNVTYALRDTNGGILAIGNGTLAPGAHRAKFIDQLSDLAPDFILPADFSSTTRFGSLELKSSNSHPLSVVALRLTTNQREETLITSTPIADETKPLNSDPLYFPHVVDGGGYKTTLILLNTSTTRETGTLRIFKNDGSPLTIAPVGGNPDSSFAYAIQPGGVYVLQSDGS